MGIARSAILSPALTRTVAAALLVMAVARFAPLSVAPYLIAVAGVVALWPLAFEMWRHPTARRSGPSATAAGDLMTPAVNAGVPSSPEAR